MKAELTRPPPNRFFTDSDDRYDHPSDYYAFVDQIEGAEIEGDDSATALLDCIGAGWLDARVNAADDDLYPSDAPLAVLQVEL
ncbi:MAG: hypothetical protein RLN69_13280, partial [Woeseiaceae bacterium]